MLKFGMALSNNEHGLGLVFEPRNLELLAQDRPILINLADVGLSFVRRKHGKGRILIAHTTNPGQFFEEVSQVTGLPILPEQPANIIIVLGTIKYSIAFSRLFTFFGFLNHWLPQMLRHADPRAVGWMPSGKLSSGSAATPPSRNGMSATPLSAASSTKTRSKASVCSVP